MPTIREITREVVAYEDQLAPGGQSPLWAAFCGAAQRLTGVLPQRYSELFADPVVPEAFAAYWRALYQLANAYGEISRSFSEKPLQLSLVEVLALDDTHRVVAGEDAWRS